MSKKVRYSFTVSFEMPEYTPKSLCREYIKDAVASWRGQLQPPCAYNDLDPGDPMWYLDPNSVRVGHVKK